MISSVARLNQERTSIFCEFPGFLVCDSICDFHISRNWSTRMRSGTRRRKINHTSRDFSKKMGVRSLIEDGPNDGFYRRVLFKHTAMDMKLKKFTIMRLYIRMPHGVSMYANSKDMLHLPAAYVSRPQPPEVLFSRWVISKEHIRWIGHTVSKKTR